MPDDLDIIHPEDGKQINLNQRHEVRYWCRKFGCTKDQLKAAVRAVGTSPDDVEAWLLLNTD